MLLGLTTGDGDAGAAELAAGERAGEVAGAEAGAGDVGSGGLGETLGDEFEDDGDDGGGVTDAGLLWVHALVAAITVTAAQAALTALRPHPCLATARA